jgi:uncharacterized membrane protein YphA (DoxX/SURF4 family)
MPIQWVSESIGKSDKGKRGLVFRKNLALDTATMSTAVAPVSSSLHRDFALMVARIATGGAILGLHAWAQAQAAWARIFHQVAWPLAEKAGEHGIKWPVPVCTTLVVIAVMGASGLILGFLTRLWAVMLLGLVIFLGWNIGSIWYRELLGAYGVIFLMVFLIGPGLISLDSLFFVLKKQNRMTR